MMMLVVANTWVIAQKDEEDEPLPPPRRAMGPKFGGAVGLTSNLLFLDMDPINAVLKGANAAPFDGNAIFMNGVQGYGYILLLKNFRVGWMGASGTRKSTSLEILQSQITIRRDVELSVGYGGVTLDYVLPVIPRLDVTAGFLLGSGGMSFKLTKDDGTAKLWSSPNGSGGIWDGFGKSDASGNPSNYSTTLSGSFFVYQPSVNFEYALLRWLGLRVGASYSGMAGNSWKVDDNYDLLGVPDKINGRGWMLNGGIFLGTFIF